jgi:predicted RNA-binding Zn-ribbon protein involved in translation (DUF1610 family)
MSNIEKCPNCRVELEVEDSVYDQVFECPGCKSEVMIPRHRMLVRMPVPRVIIAAPAKSISDENIGAAYIIALAVPFIGFFVGIYLLMKKEAGHGLACVALSIVSAIGWCWMLL